MKTSEEIAEEIYEGGNSIQYLAQTIRQVREEVREECVKVLVDAHDGGIYADIIRAIEIK